MLWVPLGIDAAPYHASTRLPDAKPARTSSGRRVETPGDRRIGSPRLEPPRGPAYPAAGTSIGRFSEPGEATSNHVVQAPDGRNVQLLLGAVGTLSTVHLAMGGADPIEKRALEVRLPGRLYGEVTTARPPPSRAKLA
jgi:hypothetical protein